MSKYLYGDEDNAPMNEDATPGIRMDWKRYSDIIAEMQKEEPVPFTDPPLPEKGCWNCNEYDGDRCMKDWNNADESYYFPDRDDKEPTDSCDEWSLNPEGHEEKRQILRKLSGNPIFTDEIRSAVRYAVNILDDNIWLRKQYMDLKQMYESYKKRHGGI